jgi:protein-S-isoprenylcysteine O-methyltransferase Ste14
VIQQTIARLRVPLGFLFAVLAFWLAHPTVTSLEIGGVVALIGEAVRVWASGHIEKGREVTRSGPYRFVRHPLYLGSSIMAAGFVIAAHSAVVGAIVSIYLVVTYVAAIRTEEATLDARFAGQYSEYRAGRAEPVARSFSLARVLANKEYRAIVGLSVAFEILWWLVPRA